MDTVKEIYQKLLELWNSNIELFTQVKELKQKVFSFFDLIEKFFSVVPPEVILLILFFSLVMVILNNISPTTPRINLTVGVLIFGVIYVYVVHVFTNEWKIFRIIYISAFVLVPAYFLEIVSFIRKLYLRSTLNYENLNSPLVKNNLQDIHFHYAEFINSQNFLTEQPEKFAIALKKLENSVSQLRTTIEKSKK
ncbi:MAG: hypothetical protein N3A69_06780 [Leptospiraceae bacterium]|nr:hypothetical protein [Leptospiraceae bacterium]